LPCGDGINWVTKVNFGTSSGTRSQFLRRKTRAQKSVEVISCDQQHRDISSRRLGDKGLVNHQQHPDVKVELLKIGLEGKRTQAGKGKKNYGLSYSAEQDKGGSQFSEVVLDVCPRLWTKVSFSTICLKI